MTSVLYGGILEMMLVVTRRIFDEVDEPLAAWIAVFAGALVMASGSRPRWSSVSGRHGPKSLWAAGSWQRPGFRIGSASGGRACAYAVVGSVVSGIAVVGIGSSRAGLRPLEFSQRRASQPC